MAEPLNGIDFENKQVLVFRPGNWNGQKYTKDDVNMVFANTIKQGVDLPFRPHQSFFSDEDEKAEGWVDRKSLELSKSGTVTGTISNVTEEMVEKLQKKNYRYVSPEVAFPTYEAMKDGDMTEAYIMALAPVARPAIRPQKPLTKLEDGSCHVQMFDDDVMLDDTETTTHGTHIHNHIYIDGDGKFRPDNDKELIDMADKKEEVKDTKVELTDDMKATLADIEKQKTEIAEQRAELSTSKVRRFAEAKLVPKTKLHPVKVEEFVEKTMELNLDDAEKDKAGKTALDLRLDYEFDTRGASADFSDTAEVPAQNEGGKKKDELDLAAVRDELTEDELAKLDLADAPANSGDDKDEGNELDALSMRLKSKLDCSLDRAQDLALKMLTEKG